MIYIGKCGGVSPPDCASLIPPGEPVDPVLLGVAYQQADENPEVCPWGDNGFAENYGQPVEDRAVLAIRIPIESEIDMVWDFPGGLDGNGEPAVWECVYGWISATVHLVKLSGFNSFDIICDASINRAAFGHSEETIVQNATFSTGLVNFGGQRRPFWIECHMHSQYQPHNCDDNTLNGQALAWATFTLHWLN